MLGATDAGVWNWGTEDGEKGLIWSGEGRTLLMV